MIVITGGAGFIGSNLVAAQAARGREVVVCDWLGNDERWRNLRKHEIAGLVEPEQLRPFLDGNRKVIEAIFHLGSITSTAETNVDLVVRQNIQPTLALLDWCTQEGMPFIYASSAATYGDGTAGFRDDERPEELAKLRPLNAYGWSKHVVDRRVARLKARGEKLPPQIVGLKFFNVFGPNEHHKGGMRSVIATNYAQAARGDAIRLFRSRHPGYPDGGQLRDFIYVRDCVEIMLWLQENPSISGLFNLGTGQARTWWDLARAMFTAVGQTGAIEFMDMPAQISASYQNYTRADITKLRGAGYDRPFMSLEDGVLDYISNYLAKNDPYF
jgi:ADP-L-glycero-D-manno-heptose 6-epimerase